MLPFGAYVFGFSFSSQFLSSQNIKKKEWLEETRRNENKPFKSLHIWSVLKNHANLDVINLYAQNI
jgi:hypothetical protein